jgi:hypothetical protein
VLLQHKNNGTNKGGSNLTIAALLLMIGFAVAFTTSVRGQTTTGSIFGTVSDPTGAVIPDARVKVLNVQTGIAQETLTNGSGNYVFPSLASGDYTVAVMAKGFSTETESGIHLDVNQNANASLQLKPGSENETVTVAAATTLVETRESQLSETVDQKRIEDLPLNGRDPYSLVQIVPGVSNYTAQAATGDQQGTKFSVNGNRVVQNTEYLDGILDTLPYTTGGGLLPNPDALQEFRLLTSDFDAEFGRFPGGVVNAITRSGGNQFHGGIHEYFRNNVLNAKSYFNTSVTPLKQNQFGGVLGGPIRRNKAFFFGSYEGLRVDTPAIVAAGAVPTLTPRETTGDFTDLPPSQQPKVSCNGVSGVICPNLLDPVAHNLIKYLPLEDPTTHISPQQEASANSTSNQVLGRVDYQFNSSHQLAVTYFETHGTTLNPLQHSQNILDYSGASLVDHIYNAAVSDVWTISSNKLNTARIFYMLNHFNEFNLFNDPTWASLGSSVGVGSSRYTQPEFAVTGYWIMGMSSGGPDNLHQHGLGATDTFNWTRGNHELKLGGSFTWYIYHEHGEYDGNGIATFNGSVTGNAAADFLEGHASSFRQNNGANHDLVAPSPALFAQDNWRVTHKLTLDLGLRWEAIIPFKGQNNMGTFDPYVQSVRFPTAPLGLVSSGDPGIPDGIIHDKWLYFAPRVGFAYDVFGNGATAVRGAFGIFYGAKSVSQTTNPEQQPFIRDITISGTPNLVTPYAPNPDPFPYVVNLTNPTFLSNTTISGFPLNAGFPYVYEYNLTVEQKLGSAWGLRLAYVGANSHKNYISWDQNEPNYVPGASTSTAGLDARRPYEPTPSTYVFSQIVINGDAGNGTYNSLQATLTRRFTRGFSVLASYVWAKSEDVSSIEPANITLTLSNQLNPRADWARSDFNVPQRFVASYIWSTPNVQYLGAFGRKVLNQWQFNGITTLSQGLPFTVLSGVDSNLDSVNTDRPNQIGNPILTGLSRRAKAAEQFNIAAFAQVPAGVPYGNVRRNSLLAPGFINTDLSLFKNIAVWENKGTIQFRAEVFNVFNNVNMAAPTSTLTSPADGKVTALATNAGPRIAQFALRYTF